MKRVKYQTTELAVRPVVTVCLGKGGQAVELTKKKSSQRRLRQYNEVVEAICRYVDHKVGTNKTHAAIVVPKALAAYMENLRINDVRPHHEKAVYKIMRKMSDDIAKARIEGVRQMNCAPINDKTVKELVRRGLPNDRATARKYTVRFSKIGALAISPFDGPLFVEDALVGAEKIHGGQVAWSERIRSRWDALGEEARRDLTVVFPELQVYDDLQLATQRPVKIAKPKLLAA